jgi:uncharacterized membrane protein YdjX (TVP38/TMEM64 family)
MTKSGNASTWRRLGGAGVLGVLWALFPAVGGFALLHQLGPVSDWLLRDRSTGLALYVALFMISAGFGLLPTYAQAILGGWVFGMSLGFPAALAGFAGASLIGYALARTVSRDRVRGLIAEHAKAKAIRDALIGKGFWPTLGTITLLRIPPNSPFALTNLAMASTGVPIFPYIIGTIVGMAPRTAIAVFIAAQTAEQTGAKDIQTALQQGKSGAILIGGIVVLVAALGILGYVSNKAVARLNAVAGSGG